MPCVSSLIKTLASRRSWKWWIVHLKAKSYWDCRVSLWVEECSCHQRQWGSIDWLFSSSQHYDCDRRSLLNHKVVCHLRVVLHDMLQLQQQREGGDHDDQHSQSWQYRGSSKTCVTMSPGSIIWFHVSSNSPLVCTIHSMMMISMMFFIPLMDSKPYETSWSAVTPFPRTFLISHWVMFTLTILFAWSVICRLMLMAWLLLNWVTVSILRRFTVITP